MKPLGASHHTSHLLSKGLEVPELFEDSLLRHPELVDEAADGNHCEARVLDLSQAVPLQGSLILGKVERVKGEVTRGALAQDGFVESNNTKNLNKGDPEDDLLATTLGDEVIVGIDGGELGEEGEGVKLLDDEASDGKHGEAAVLQLSLTQHAEIKNIGEALSQVNVSPSHIGVRRIQIGLGQR